MNSGCGSYHIFVHFLSLVLLFSLSLSLSLSFSLSHTHTHTYGLEVFLIFSALDSSSVENKHKYTSSVLSWSDWWLGGDYSSHAVDTSMKNICKNDANDIHKHLPLLLLVNLEILKQTKNICKNLGQIDDLVETTAFMQSTPQWKTSARMMPMIYINIFHYYYWSTWKFWNKLLKISTWILIRK